MTNPCHQPCLIVQQHTVDSHRGVSHIEPISPWGGSCAWFFHHGTCCQVTNIFYICLLKPPCSRWLNPEVGWFKQNVPQGFYLSWTSMFEMVDVTCRLFEASKTRYSKVGRLKTEKENFSTRWLIGFSNMGQFIIHFHLVHKSKKNSWWIIYNYKPLLAWAIPISYTMSYSLFQTEVSGKKKGYLQIIHLEALGLSVINQLLGIPFMETPKWLPELIDTFHQ